MRIAAFALLTAIAAAGLIVGLVRTAGHPLPTTQALGFDGATMGTTYSVKLVGLPPGVSRDQVAAVVQQELGRIENLMSTYKPDSELSRFNAAPASNWFPVSKDTAQVVAEAIRVARLSDGALDVTVGPVVDLWSFGTEARPQGVVPTADQIAQASSAVGFEQIEARLDPPALRKSSKQCRLDLSAVAKGFAVDQVARRLTEMGIDRSMVEVGGEVRTAGRNTDGQPWHIAVETPDLTGRNVQRVVDLHDRAMATSGDYRNYFEKDGFRFCHIIDPRTGRPVTHRLASVTVLADTCMEADALATALFVLGPDKGMRLAADKNLAVLMLVRTDQGFEHRGSPSFPKEEEP